MATPQQAACFTAAAAVQYGPVRWMAKPILPLGAFDSCQIRASILCHAGVKHLQCMCWHEAVLVTVKWLVPATALALCHKVQWTVAVGLTLPEVIHLNNLLNSQSFSQLS
jgi:hypothetical protein